MTSKNIIALIIFVVVAALTIIWHISVISAGNDKLHKWAAGDEAHMQIYPPRPETKTEIHATIFRAAEAGTPKIKTPPERNEGPLTPRNPQEYKLTVEKEKPEETEEEPATSENTRTYVGKLQVYGYDTCAQCCGWSTGITASGTTATVGRTVASNDYPFGTRLYIEGIGERVVEDRGGMDHGVLDVLCENHPACYAITGTYDVWILEGSENDGC